MATQITATHQTQESTLRPMRTAFDAQPIPRPSSRRATNKTEQVKQERLLNLSDAAVVVQWLNAAKDARATASYKQVTNIRQQLAELRTLRERLKECGPDPQEDAAAWREYEVQKAKLKPGHKSEPVTFPAYRNPRLDLKLRGQINRSCSSLNEALKKYAFRPQVAHARLPGFSVLQNLWAGGMVPDSNKRWFQMKINAWTISEADVVLALVRLDLSGEVHKVRLCEMCKDRWRVAEKSNYRFCSAQCREAFYVSQPGYDEQKAKNQRKYRTNLKKIHAAQDAARKGR